MVAGVVATLVLAGLAAVHCYGRQPGPPGSGRVAVGWPENLDAADAAGLLADLGLVRHRAAAELYLKSSRASECFRPGPHLLPRNAAPERLRRLLCRTSDRQSVRITVPEGFTRFAIAERLHQLGICSRQAFLYASADTALLRALGVEAASLAIAETAEGYLFPATYEFPFDSDPRRVVRRLVTELSTRWRRVTAAHPGAIDRLEQALGWGRRDVLTLASMVEKEARVPEERPLIASVFLNRLLDPSFRPKLLQSDPTAAYGCLAAPEQIVACDDFTGRVTPRLNQDRDNVYSTYVNAGLPPGPVANPGELSIDAVLAPAETAHLYFVSAGDGARHVFSDDYEAHKRAVRRLRDPSNL